MLELYAASTMWDSQAALCETAGTMRGSQHVLCGAASTYYVEQTALCERHQSENRSNILIIVVPK